MPLKSVGDIVNTKVKVSNAGDQPYYFTVSLRYYHDQSGEMVVNDASAVPQLAPGEGAEVTFQDVVGKGWNWPKGVYRAVVTLLSQSNSALDSYSGLEFEVV